MLAHATGITQSLCELAAGPNAKGDSQVPGVKVIDVACDRLLRIADTRLGGFGSAPKFPHLTDLDLLLRRYHSDNDPKKLHVVTCSLDAMADGGIFDHVGGGFVRYRVDAHWLVPHFEKMLYDNALLARLYVDDITPHGNFEERNIPRLKQSIAKFAESRSTDPNSLSKQLIQDMITLREHRDKRIHPGRDDKVLMGWNSLAIEALAAAGAVLNEPRFVEAAEGVATFIWTKMARTGGRFYHALRRGHSHLNAFQDDLADFINAALAVFRATGKARWVDRASKVATQLIEHFEDKHAGGFYYTADDAELVIARQKDWHDGSVRSGNGSAAMGLLELATLTGNRDFVDAAKRTLIAGGEVIKKQSAAAAQLLAALDRFHRSDEQLVIAARSWDEAELLRAAYPLRLSTTCGPILGHRWRA